MRLANAISLPLINCVRNRRRALIPVYKLEYDDRMCEKLPTSFNLFRPSVKRGPLDLMYHFRVANATRLAQAIAKPP